MYDRSSATSRADEERLELFARKQRSYDSIPQTETALVQHVKRDAYQADYIWANQRYVKWKQKTF